MQCLKDLPFKTSWKCLLINKTFWVEHNEPISLIKLAWRSSSQSILENILLAKNTIPLKKSAYSWHIGNFFRCFEWKYCAVLENVFLCLLYIYTFPITSFHFFVNWLSKVENLIYKGPNFGVSRMNWVPNQILRFWYTERVSCNILFKKISDSP